MRQLPDPQTGPGPGPALLDLQSRDPYPCAWLECATPTNGYYAILGMELSEAGRGPDPVFRVELPDSLKSGPRDGRLLLIFAPADQSPKRAPLDVRG